MSLLASIYTENNYQEVFFPEEDNIDYSVHIDSGSELMFKKRKGQWSISTSGSYSFTGNGDVLRDGSSLHIITDNGTEMFLFIQERKQYTNPYTQYDITDRTKLTIGRSEKNDISFNVQDITSSEHVRLTRKGKIWEAENFSPNGFYIESRRITDSVELHYGDMLNVSGVHIVLLGNVLAVDTVNHKIDCKLPKSNTEEQSSEQKQVQEQDIKIISRSPRTVPHFHTRKITIAEPPVIQKKDEQPIIYRIGPSITMALPMLVSVLFMVWVSKITGQNDSSMMLYRFAGITMIGTSAVMTTVWTILSIRYEKKQKIKKEEERKKVYSDYLVKKAEQVRTCYEQNRSIWQNSYPEINLPKGEIQDKEGLWSRTRKDEDFGKYRIGIGNRPTEFEVEIPDKGISMNHDALTEKPKVLKKEFSTQYDIPILLDLSDGKIVGVTASDDIAAAWESMRTIAVQAAASEVYTERKIAVFLDGKDPMQAQIFASLRWLPHCWSPDYKTRFYATDESSTNHIASCIRDMTKKQDNTKDRNVSFLVIVADDRYLKEEPFYRTLMAQSQDSGYAVLVCKSRKELLPLQCRTYLEVGKQDAVLYTLDTGTAEHVQTDQVTDITCNAFCRSLSRFRVMEDERESGIPDSLTFLDMYRIHSPEELNPEDRWLKNRTYDHIQGLIGRMDKGKDCYLDINEKYHGPHGLVAGTTGSGKSETLQTWLLSLAAEYSPEDINFFLIDFKGGGMADLFDGLPHVAGKITNLSGNLVTRAMISIKAENKRRQKLFSEAGVNNINGYTKLYRKGQVSEPIPHLLIVIDEFAELKKELPDFMQDIISVAQIGRSLGVHLVLATQKPSGTVNDTIRSNMKFRLCLRVQDKADSRDMIGISDAAYIREPGRGFLQTGEGEIPIEFQSGWSGAVYHDVDYQKNDTSVCMIGPSGQDILQGSVLSEIKAKEQEQNWKQNVIKVLSQVEKNVEDSQKSGHFRFHISKEKLKEQVIRPDIFSKIGCGSSEKDKEAVCGLIDYAMSSERGWNDERLLSDPAVPFPSKIEKTEFDAVKDTIRRAAEKAAFKKPWPLWTPPLNAVAAIPDHASGHAVELGISDDPEEQTRHDVFYDLTDGRNLAVIGPSGSGKSVLLQTLLYGLCRAYTAEEVQLYILDYGNASLKPFALFPHTGGVVTEDRPEQEMRSIMMLDHMFHERKKLLSGGSFRYYKDAEGKSLPAVFIVIDNISGFLRAASDSDADFIRTLAKEGNGVGMFLAVSASSISNAELPARLFSNIQTVYALQVREKYEASEYFHGKRPEIMPDADKAGRGLALYQERVLEFQTYLPFGETDDYKRSVLLEEAGKKLAENYSGKPTVLIPDIPEVFGYQQFKNMLENGENSIRTERFIPFAKDYRTVSTVCLDRKDDFIFQIAGGPRTGKRSLLKVMMHLAIDQGIKVVLFDLGRSGLAGASREMGVEVLRTPDEVYTYCKDVLTPVLEKVQDITSELKDRDADEDEIFDVLQQETDAYLFCFADLADFTEKTRNDKRNIQGFFRTIFLKGEGHNQNCVGILTTQDRSTLRDGSLLQAFTSGGTGVWTGGNAEQSVSLNISGIPYKQMSMSEKPGIGYLVRTGMPSEKIVIPKM